MNLYLLSQTDNNGYDTYDSVVVAANTEQEARETHPHGYEVWKEGAWYNPETQRFDKSDYEWTTPDKVVVKLIGTAIDGTEAGVVLASFNAG